MWSSGELNQQHAVPLSPTEPPTTNKQKAVVYNMRSDHLNAGVILRHIKQQPHPFTGQERTKMASSQVVSCETPLVWCLRFKRQFPTVPLSACDLLCLCTHTTNPASIQCLISLHEKGFLTELRGGSTHTWYHRAVIRAGNEQVDRYTLTFPFRMQEFMVSRRSGLFFSLLGTSVISFPISSPCW